MGMAQSKWASLCGQAVDWVLPPRCVVSGDPVDRQGMLAPQVWRDLQFISEPACVQCGYPFDFEVESGARCTECLENPPPFATARAPLKYDDIGRELILGFKAADKMHAVRAFMPWLAASGAHMLAEADYLVPVPLHRWRLLKRRYNQAAIIAQALSRHTGVPSLNAALQRTRYTPIQSRLEQNERAKNVRRAFAVYPRYASQIHGKTIILIDDVYTTGATVKECTKALLKSGAGKVHVLTVTRVVGR